MIGGVFARSLAHLMTCWTTFFQSRTSRKYLIRWGFGRSSSLRHSKLMRSLPYTSAGTQHVDLGPLVEARCTFMQYGNQCRNPSFGSPVRLAINPEISLNPKLDRQSGHLRKILIENDFRTQPPSKTDSPRRPSTMLLTQKLEHVW